MKKYKIAVAGTGYVGLSIPKVKAPVNGIILRRRVYFI